MKISKKNKTLEYLNILKKDPKLYQAVKSTLTEMDNVGGENNAEELYVTVFAPVMVGFIEWVLSEAERKGIQRLYFLARDGYQMYITAKNLCQNRGLNIDCRYLYGSRYAWRMPQFSLMGDECLEMICRGGIDVTFEKVMKRGGLTEEEALAVAHEQGFISEFKTPLSYSQTQQLKTPLKKSALFLDYVYAHSKAAYETTLGYLEQEGLFEDVTYALVDSGWTGSLQQTLSQLLQYAEHKKQLQGFYFGLYELPSGVEKNSYNTYYFGPNHGLRRKVYFSNCLYEAVYSAPHGMTMSYKKQENGYAPVFYREENLNQLCMKQEVCWLEKFLRNYQGKSEKEMSFALLRKFMGNPSKDEVEVYGSLLFSDDVTEEHTQCVAANLSKEEIKNQYIWNKVLIMLGIRSKVLKDSAWLEGSVTAAGGTVRWSLWNVAVYKYLIYIRKSLKNFRNRR